MTTKHTPGPWFVAKLASHAYCRDFGIYAEGAPRDLARVMGENSASDAALIAAAPKLLAALREIVRGITPDLDTNDCWYLKKLGLCAIAEALPAPEAL